MPDNTLRVLIVEDLESVTKVLERALEVLPFKRLIIKKVQNLADALELIEEDSFDLVTLDLKLKDSSPENTLKHVQQIEECCPVIIVTGSLIEGFENMLSDLQVEVVKKGQTWIDSFIEGAVRTVKRGSERQYAKMKARIDKLKDLQSVLHPPDHPNVST